MRNVALHRANVGTTPRTRVGTAARAANAADGGGSSAPVRDRPRSSDRVLQLLAAVGSAPNGLSLTEAAVAVGLVPSTALRQLRSLEAAGMLTRSDDDQVYRAGPQLVDLARTVFVGHSLATLAQPFLDQLSIDTGESAYLAVVEASRTAVYIAAAPGQHALRHTGWLGRGFTSTGTAAGSALRGRVDDDGTVVRDGTVEDGITAVSAPVRGVTGIVAAVNLVGPTFRLGGHELAAARIRVALAAADLSHALGAAEPR